MLFTCWPLRVVVLVYLGTWPLPLPLKIQCWSYSLVRKGSEKTSLHGSLVEERRKIFLSKLICTWENSDGE